MGAVKARSSSSGAKRGQGRPIAGENDVGRERLLAATETLLRTLPPARVNVSRIAKEANADPALVRYYFGDRIKLLMAIVDRIAPQGPRTVEPDADPETAITERIASTVEFVCSNPFMHRLVIEELAQEGTDETRARVRGMNLGLVNYYRQLLERDGGARMNAPDPLLLHLIVLGASDFFASAEPLIAQLVPEGTDMAGLTRDFQATLIDLVMNGLRKR